MSLFFRYRRKKKIHKALDSQVKRQISKQINSGKYIPDTFIEIGQHKDLLRYFSDPVTFSEKCLNEAQVLDFSSLEKRLKKLSKNKFGFKPQTFTYTKDELNIQNIQEKALHWLDYLNKVNDKIDKIDLGNECSHFSYKLRENLLDFESLSSRVALVTEMPGQGKTNFVCDFSDNFLLKSQIPTLFLLGTEIDAADIRKSIIKKIYPDDPNITFETLMLEIQDICYASDKCFVIIIDGLNENGNPKTLGKNLESFISEILEYDFVRIILTCRTEYYKTNFSVLENSSFKNSILTIDSLRGRGHHRDNEVSEKLFNTYMYHFKIKYQSFSPKAYEQLVSNFLLLRIYCDAYHGTNAGEVDNIYKEELFTHYFEIKSKEINDRLNSNDEFGIIAKIDIQKFMLNIVEYMVINSQYSNIPFEKIVADDRTRQLYVRFLDENILVRRDLQTEDIIFGTTEVINFTFDEFRDFLISRYLISKTYRESETKFKDFLENNLNDDSPIQEGCGTFLFHASRKNGDKRLSEIVKEQKWYDKIFRKAIFNLKDEFITEDDRERIFNSLPQDRYSAAKTIIRLIRRADTVRYPKLNIKHLFDYLGKLDYRTYNKAFVEAFSQSEYYNGLINQNDFVIRFKEKIEDKSNFQPKNHSQFEVLLYMFTNPNSNNLKIVYEKYCHKFPKEAKEQLRKGLQSANEDLVKEINSFCKRYGILL